MKAIPNPIYSRRKRFLPEYRELFAVLLKIPDEDVRDRVTNAINGIQKCPNCENKNQREIMLVDVGTQTDSSIWPGIINADREHETTIIKREDREKRRRRRKRNCPKVVKTAQHSSNVPVLKQESNQTTQNTSNIEERPPKLMRQDSNDDAVSIFFETFNSNVFSISNQNESLLQNQSTLEKVKNQMAIEWQICEVTNNAGFLPIHEAIVQNELTKLRRQLYVWKFRRCNLMDLLTEDNDNLIQLAIKENCFKSIIDELLNENLNLNDVDNDCNNLIHLAILHLSDDDNDDAKQQKRILETLESLLNKVDLNILLQKNDDGLTPLHIAVKKNEYLIAEKILSVVDRRLSLKSATSLNNSGADIQTFSRYYCDQCINFEFRDRNDLKENIINATDMKRGCSVLYFAMELGFEHLVYLLLAHMCNPAIKNLAGSDAKTYYTEFGKNASIIGVLDKLSTIFLQT